MKYVTLTIGIPEEEWNALNEQYREAGNIVLKFRRATVYGQPPAWFPNCELTPGDGHIGDMLKKTRRAMQKAGYSQHQLADFYRRALALSSYGAELELCAEYVNVLAPALLEEPESAQEIEEELTESVGKKSQNKLHSVKLTVKMDEHGTIGFAKREISTRSKSKDVEFAKTTLGIPLYLDDLFTNYPME